MEILQKWEMMEISFFSKLLSVKLFCGFMNKTTTKKAAFSPLPEDTMK